MPAAEGVFINVPFDPSYERLLVALVAGLATLGLEPRSILEVPPQVDRLSRLKAIIGSCRYSVHDLSCRTARFNMPFELGLTLGLHEGRRCRHVWFVLDRRKYTLKKVLSDLDGYDAVYVHSRSPAKLLERLHEAFDRPGVRLADLERTRRQLQKYAAANLKAHLFTRAGFQDLAYTAATLVANAPVRGSR